MVTQRNTFLQDFYLDLLKNPPFIYSIECSEKNKLYIQKVYDSCKDLFAPIGYNLGMNVNDAAGQRVSHVHMHVFPRYKEDLGVVNAMRKIVFL